MRMLGTDPGLSGAIALIDTATGNVCAHDMPVIPYGKARLVNATVLSSLVEDFDPEFSIIEQVASRPGQGIATTSRFMHAAGTAYGAIAGKGIPFHFVVPQKWKRDLGLLGEGKEASRQLALKLYPQAAPFLKRKKDHDRAEALLLAHWGLMNPKRIGLATEKPRSLQRA